MKFSIYTENGSGQKYNNIEDFLNEIRLQIEDCKANGGTYYSLTIDSDASCFLEEDE